MKLSEKVDILIVDDREDGLIALEAVLQSEHYNLVKASSGREAISLLPSYDFSMILLDVQMPELDGFQTAELIKSQNRFKHIPIVFVTAINKEERYVFRGYETGAFDYIFKPFDPHVLKSKVAVFAELHLKNRQLRDQSIRILEQESLERQAYIQSMEIDSLRRYQNLADAIPHMVWRATPDGRVEYFNKIWCQYTGRDLPNSLGTEWQTAFEKEDLKTFLKIWIDAMENGEGFEVECRICRHDGKYRWHWVQAVAERDSQGRFIAWLGTCTDIEDRKVVEDRLVIAQRNSESANQAKTQFLANMSHEIRTPLNAIMGFTDLMLDPHLSYEERTNAISIVRRNGGQLLKIIDEILDISKIEAGKMDIESVDTNILGVLSGVRSLMNVTAVKKNVNLTFEIDNEIPKMAVTDPTRLRQILINVIGNAIKFTEKGSVTVTASYEKSESRNFLYFKVKDTGLGLDLALSEKIFVPFSQADCSTTRIYGGTGLGLTLSRRLARALGGDVWLAGSELGKGSTFIAKIDVEVPFPVQWARRFSDIDFDESKNLKESQLKILKGKRILVVEDAKDNQVLITRFLQGAGAEIDIANNGEEGVAKALANDYEAILMDIQMPLLDGYEATSRLRSQGYNRPIIALTAHALKVEKEKCLFVGCDEHLTKPIDRNVLIESLTRFVNL